MSDVQKIKTEVMTCQDCIYADVDHIGCSRPDDVAECFDDDNTQYIYISAEDK